MKPERSVHAKCAEPERDENGDLTGAVCVKSHGHVNDRDRRRQMHFDLDRERSWFDDAQLDRILRGANDDLLAEIEQRTDVNERLRDLYHRAEISRDRYL